MNQLYLIINLNIHNLISFFKISKLTIQIYHKSLKISATKMSYLYPINLVIFIPIQSNEVNFNFVMNLLANYEYIEHVVMIVCVLPMISEGFMIKSVAGLILSDLMEMVILTDLLKMNVELLYFELDSQVFDSHEMLPLNIFIYFTCFIGCLSINWSELFLE